MYGPGEQFLAGACLSKDEDRGLGLGDLRALLEEVPHNPGAADHALELTAPNANLFELEQARQGFLLTDELLDSEDQGLGVVFEDDIFDAAAERFSGVAGRGVGGPYKNLCEGGALAQGLSAIVDAVLSEGALMDDDDTGLPTEVLKGGAPRAVVFEGDGGLFEEGAQRWAADEGEGRGVFGHS